MNIKIAALQTLLQRYWYIEKWDLFDLYFHAEYGAFIF